MTSQQQSAEIIKRLKKKYPDVRTSLNYSSPFELLVSTILSAQSTDIHINKVTVSLFRKYRSIKDYADTPLDELKKDLSSVNFYNNKAKNIQASARMIIEKFSSKVPDRMDDLITLPGVARKTANIVLSGAYGINEGIAVDTHVKRLSYRLGLSKNEDPVKIEIDLMAITPKKKWSSLSHLLIFHGRKVCQAKKPLHKECVLYDICPSRNI